MGRQKRSNPKKMKSEMSKCRQDDIMLGPKIENVDFRQVFVCYMKGQRVPKVFQEDREICGKLFFFVTLW